VEVSEISSKSCSLFGIRFSMSIASDRNSQTCKNYYVQSPGAELGISSLLSPVYICRSQNLVLRPKMKLVVARLREEMFVG
jgi:hypothetical protein